MRKNIHILLLMLISTCIVSAQENFNLTLVANVSVGENGNDIWGYVDEDGIEYAVMGSQTKASVFSLEDPANPKLIGEVPGASSTWRDMKSYNDHVYFTTDVGADGLGIIDMSYLPDSITYTYWTPLLTVGDEGGVLGKCHNLYIDSLGYCYLSGCNAPTDGVMIFDLNQNPKEPVLVGAVTDNYSHDVYVRDTLLYTSEIYAGTLGIYSISDRSNPVLLANQITTTTFTHNAWLSDDGNVIYTTDEKANAYVDAYDISDLDDIKFLDKFQPKETAGRGVIPHNTHVIGDYLVTSWYTDGVVITDVSDPSNMVKVASYDTYLGTDGGFSGCWGVYPWLPSGLIIASDINSGLYVLEPEYVKASYLEGTVTDADTGEPIFDAKITLEGESVELTTSNANGGFRTGHAKAGMINVVVSHPLYETKTISADFTSGETTTIDVSLNTNSIQITGVVKDEEGNPIPNAILTGQGEEIEFTGQTDDNGAFVLNVLSDVSTVYIGAWGYETKAFDLDTSNTTGNEYVLKKGYQDEFALDLGWTTTATASAGLWELGVPMLTVYEGEFSNPGEDSQNDLGDKCYITGNAGGGAGDDDVDNGTVTLLSPIMDLSGYANPTLTFDYWFFNAGGFSAPNDALEVLLANEQGQAVSILNTGSESTNGWTTYSNSIKDILDDYSAVQLVVSTSDFDGSGHLVEAAIDKFSIKDETDVSVEEELTTRKLKYNNPINKILNIESSQRIKSVVLYAVNGAQLLSQSFDDQTINVDLGSLDSGIYLAKVQMNDGSNEIAKIIKK